ncbi:unnamed protein product [Schistocephalus solidus]|uniref:C2H2-type domain-containing protein n=1 Tax=Schistocephalus solidus TaxID=70667 RepID=A0A183TMR2_SCHSO|nr:unnamed protein product [Schistocephalus solidus]
MLNELANRLATLPVTDMDISLENRWCQMRDTIQSTAPDVLGRACRQHHDWFDDNDADINALLVEKNQGYKAYIEHPTAANDTAFYRSRYHLLRSSHQCSNLSRNTKIDYDIADRIATASEAFGRIQSVVWDRKQLQISPATWEELAWNRLAWRRTVKTGAAPCEANRIANAQDLPTCTSCQRTLHTRIGLVGHLRTQCTNNSTILTSVSNSANPPSDSPTLTPGINSNTPTIKETTSQYSSPVTSTTAAATTISDWDSLLNCPQCDRTFTSRMGLVGHLRIHRTETGKPVLKVPTHSRDRRLHCPHCPRAFTHRMGLFGHMRIHDSGIHRNADNTD